MRTHLMAVLILLAGAASACRTTAGKEATAGSASPQSIEARVDKVGTEDGTVTLRAGETRREILVMPDTEIRIDDFVGTFEDIREGQRVRASFRAQDGQTEGVRIDILDRGASVSDASEQPAEAGGTSSAITSPR